MHVADVDLGLTSPSPPTSVFSCHGFSSRKTNCACARRGFKRTTSISFDELYFATAGSETIKHTVKYTKYTFAYCRPLIADMLLMGGAIRQHCASCHVTAISYVYSTRKMSSFFRMSYCLNTLNFGNISSASRSVGSVLIII